MDELSGEPSDAPETTNLPTHSKSSDSREATPQEPLTSLAEDDLVPADLGEASPTESSSRPLMSRHSSSYGRSTPAASQSQYQSRHYQLVAPATYADPRAMSQNDKDQLIQSLRTHRVNTITELRRIEKIFAYLDSAEVTEPMTSAWAHYVNSNNLLNELRGLTRTYPFSSECLDEAKQLVVRDPSSVRSWNYCWLVLVKIEREDLVTKHARALASKASTWGGRKPTQADIDRLVGACVAEWSRALRQMLRHWDRPPSTTGH